MRRRGGIPGVVMGRRARPTRTEYTRTSGAKRKGRPVGQRNVGWLLIPCRQRRNRESPETCNVVMRVVAMAWSIRKSVFLLLVVLMVGLSPSRARAGLIYDFVNVADTSGPIYSDLFVPSLNNNAQVAFYGETSQRNIYRWDSTTGATTTIASAGGSIKSVGFYPTINNAGDVALSAACASYLDRRPTMRTRHLLAMCVLSRARPPVDLLAWPPRSRGKRSNGRLPPRK